MKYLSAFAILALLVNFGCSNNSGPGSNNNNNLNGTGALYGADYFPLNNNASWKEHITANKEYLDTNGNITGTDEVDVDSKAGLGFIETRNGRNVHPIFGTDTNDHKGIGYVGILDSEVFVNYQVRGDSNEAATILPSSLSVGLTWIPAPIDAPINCSVVQHLSQFTTKGGTSYNDVLQVHASYLDTSSNYFLDTLYQEDDIRKRSADVDLYFAKNIGLIEADLNKYEFLDNYHEIDYGNVYNSYDHWTETGTVYRKD